MSDIHLEEVGHYCFKYHFFSFCFSPGIYIVYMLQLLWLSHSPWIVCSGFCFCFLFFCFWSYPQGPRSFPQPCPPHTDDPVIGIFHFWYRTFEGLPSISFQFFCRISISLNFECERALKHHAILSQL